MSWTDDVANSVKRNLQACSIQVFQELSLQKDSTRTWTKPGGKNYYTTPVDESADYPFEFIRFFSDGLEFTKASSPTEVNSNQRYFFHDVTGKLLYGRFPGSTNPHTLINKGVVELYVANMERDLDGVRYEARLPAQSIKVQLAAGDQFITSFTLNGGGLSLARDPDGKLADLLQRFEWLDGTVFFYYGPEIQTIVTSLSQCKRTQVARIRRVSADFHPIVQLELGELAQKWGSEIPKYVFSDDADDTNESAFANIADDCTGPIPMWWGTNTAGATDAASKWARAISGNGKCIDKGTEATNGNKNCKFKFAQQVKDPEGGTHGITITEVWFSKAGGKPFKLQAGDWTTEDNGTVVKLINNRLFVHGSDELRVLGTGYKDVSGKFTGSGSSTIDKTYEIIPFLAATQMGIRWGDIDTSSIAAIRANPPAWDDSQFIYLTSATQISEVLSALQLAGWQVWQMGRDGKWCLDQKSSVLLKTDPSLLSNDYIDFKEWRALEDVISGLWLEWGFNAQTGQFKSKSQKGTKSISGFTVQDNPGQALYDIDNKVTKRTWKTSKTKVKLLLQEIFDYIKRPPHMIEFGTGGALIDQPLAGRTGITNESVLVGSVDDEPYHVLVNDRAYDNGMCDVQHRQAKKFV